MGKRRKLFVTLNMIKHVLHERNVNKQLIAENYELLERSIQLRDENTELKRKAKEAERKIRLAIGLLDAFRMSEGKADA